MPIALNVAINYIAGVVIEQIVVKHSNVSTIDMTVAVHVSRNYNVLGEECGVDFALAACLATAELEVGATYGCVIVGGWPNEAQVIRCAVLPIVTHRLAVDIY